jgi:hypothetical protein
MSQTSGPKSFQISKHLVFEAYLRVKANKGAAGVDGVSIEQFERSLLGEPVPTLRRTPVVAPLTRALWTVAGLAVGWEVR